MPLDLAALLRGDALPPMPSSDGSVVHRGPVAVVTMELQRGIMGDLAALPDLADAAARLGVVENVARLLSAARSRGVPVVHCLCGFRPDGAGTVVNTPLHVAMLRNPGHLIAGTPETELVPALGPDPGDLLCSRVHGVSPFLGTSLDAMLRTLGVRVLVVTGVSVNLGVLGLCIEAVNLGYQVVVVTDGVAGVPDDYAARVLRTTLALVATLRTVDEVIATLP